MYFFRFFICLALLGILSPSPKSMENRLPNPIPRLEFDESLSEKEQDYLLAALNDLNLKGAGKSIIAKLNELLATQDIPIVVKKGQNTLFRGPRNETSPELSINLQSLKNSFVSCIGPLRKFKHKTTHVVKEFFEIGKCKNPPSITLGHELIHAVHYLENKQTYLMRKTTAQLSWITKRTRQVSCESTARPMRVEIDSCLWDNDEEHITVWGTEERPTFSELQLRLDHTLSPRYPYKNDACFYEDSAVIIRLLTAHLGDRWNVRLNSIFKSQPWDFNQEEALESRFNSVDLSQYEEVE